MSYNYESYLTHVYHCATVQTNSKVKDINTYQEIVMRTIVRVLGLLILLVLAICASSCGKPSPGASGNAEREASEPMYNLDPDVPTEEAF